MKDVKNERFDHVLMSLRSNQANMVRHFNNLRNTTRMFRKAVYRFASDLINMEKHHHNKFLDIVKSEGVTLKKWYDDSFEILERMGERRSDLLKSIADGMTEKDYITQGPVWSVRKRSKDSRVGKTNEKQASDAITRAKPLPASKRLPIVMKQYKALKSEIRELKRDNAILLEENCQLIKVIERVERGLAKQGPKVA